MEQQPFDPRAAVVVYARHRPDDPIMGRVVEQKGRCADCGRRVYVCALLHEDADGSSTLNLVCESAMQYRH